VWPRPAGGALEAAAGAAAAVAGPQRGVVRDQRRLDGGRVAEDGPQQAPRGAGGPLGDPRRGGQALLPPGDALGSQRVQGAGRPGGADEPADQVGVVVDGADADVLHGQPTVDPLADGELGRGRIGPAAFADPGFLVAAPGERGGLGLEPGLTGLGAVRQLVLDPPRLRALTALLRVRHRQGLLSLRWG
jgi:hypothetical protein